MYLYRVESLPPMIEIETWSKNRDILKNVEMKSVQRLYLRE